MAPPSPDGPAPVARPSFRPPRSLAPPPRPGFAPGFRRRVRFPWLRLSAWALGLAGRAAAGWRSGRGLRPENFGPLKAGVPGEETDIRPLRSWCWWLVTDRGGWPASSSAQARGNCRLNLAVRPTGLRHTHRDALWRVAWVLVPSRGLF